MLNGPETILWDIIHALHDLQSKESLYLANKLHGCQIHFKNVKMKENIAAQTLFASVATAIDHLRDDIQLEQFKGSQAICQFIHTIDHLFNVLNAKNPLGKGFKAFFACVIRVLGITF